MQETPEQYTQRILGYLAGRPPLEILAATPARLARLVAGLPRRTLTRRPAPDQWCIAEVLGHLADTELVYGFRIRLILETSGAPIQGIDQEAWARFSDYAAQDAKLSLEALRTTRARLVRLLRRLPEEGWERCGIHSERGRETVARVAEMLAGHDLAHTRQIQRLLGRG